MKKIIWVFGQSATGKKTLINRLLNYDESTIKDLGLFGKSMIACTNTIIDNEEIKPTINDPFLYDDTYMEDNNAYFDKEKAINRRSCIMTDCIKFLNDDNDVLLIKGQDNDIWPNRANIVKNFFEFINTQYVEIEAFRPYNIPITMIDASNDRYLIYDAARKM